MSGVPAVAAAAANPPPMMNLALQTTSPTAAASSSSSSSFTLIVDAVVLFIRSLQLRPANIDPEEVKKACVQVVALAKDVRDSPTVDEKTKMAINKIASILGKAVADFLSTLARLQQTLRASNGGNEGEEMKAQTEQVEEKKEQLARAVGLLLRVLGVNSKAQDLVRSHSYSLIMEKCSMHQQQQPFNHKKTSEKEENGEKKGEKKEEDDEEQNDSNNVEAMRLQVRMLEEELRHVREEMQSYRQSVMLMKAEDVTKEEKNKAKKQAKSKKKGKAKRHAISHSATASPRYHSSPNKHGEDLLTVNWNTISPRSLFHKERKTKKKKEKGEAAEEETATTTKENEGEPAEEKKPPKKKHQKDERSGKYMYGFAEEGEDEEGESGDEADVNTFWKAKEEELRRREEVLNRKNEELLKRRRQKWSLRKLKKTKTEEKKSKSRKSSFKREKNHSNSNSNQQQTDLWTPSNSLKEDNRTKDGEEVDEQKEWKEELRNKQEQQELALKLHLMIRETTTTTQREETGEEDEEEEQRWRETMAQKQQEQEAKEAELKEKEKTLHRTIRERDKAIARLKREEERRAKERALQQREVELQKREEELTRKMLEEEERAEREYQALLQRLSRLGKQNTWPQDTSDIQDFLLEREQEQQTTKEKEKEGHKEEEKRRGRKDSSAAKEAERRALKKVLPVPHSRALLSRYLRDSPTLFSEDNLMFWEAVEAFRASSLSQGMEEKDYEEEEAIRDVLVRHLSSAGLQIRSELRAHLLQRLSSPEAEQETDSLWSFFDEAQEAVELSLQTSVIGGFLQSDLWKDYLQRGGPPLGADGSLLSIEKVLNRLKDSNYGLLARLRSASSSSSATAFTGRDLIDWFMEHVHLGGREEARALAERMLDLGYLQQTEYKFVQQVSDTEAPPHYFFDPNLRSINEMINNKSGGNAIVTEEEFHRLLAHMLGLEPEHEEYLGSFLRETIGGDDTATAAQLFSEWRVEDEFKSFKAFLTKHSRKIQRYIQQSLDGSESVEVEDDATKNYLDQVLVLVMKHIMFVGSTKSDATARNLHLLYRRNSNRDNKK
ncbi:Chromatin assembly factor 1 subunit A [Balamuthia mandrillaris]